MIWHDEETIKKLLKEYSNNVPIEILEKKYNCSKRTIERWCRKYKVSKKTTVCYALYDLEDNLFWLGDSKNELKHFLNISSEQISYLFCTKNINKKLRYKNKWYTKHIIPLEKEKL